MFCFLYCIVFIWHKHANSWYGPLTKQQRPHSETFKQQVAMFSQKLQSSDQYAEMSGWKRLFWTGGFGKPALEETGNLKE